jgi:hypothetical protein
VSATPPLPKDPALVRAGTAWKFAAVLWAVSKEEWRGRAHWDPARIGVAGEALLDDLCRRGRLTKERPKE